MLNPATFKFLSAIAENNDREWFALNKGDYEEARADVLKLVSELIPALSKVDPLFSADADPKKCLMRIYRDVRFSKNKDPYKKNMGIWFSATGKDGNGPGYYLHLQPGKSFLGGGYWMPDPAHLKLIRQEIDYNGSEFHEIIDNPAFSDALTFGASDMLKNAPKGYDSDHRDIWHLRLKSFEVSMPLKDEEFFKAAIVNKLINSFELVYPYIAFLRNAISS